MEEFDKDSAAENDDIRYIERYEVVKSIRILQKYLVARNKTRMGVDIDGDGYLDYIEIPVRNDFRPFIKLFINKETAKAIANLKQSSMVLLYHIMCQVPLSKDIVRLNSREATEATGLAMSTFDKAKKQLINEEWIFRVKGDDPTLYFINLMRFAKGSVEQIVREYDIKDAVDKVLRDRLKEKWTEEKSKKWKEQGREYLEELKKDPRKDINKEPKEDDN
jgi:hypothetical protein